MDESKQERLWALVPPSNVESLNPSVDALLDSLIALFYDCKATRPVEDSYMGSFVKQCQDFFSLCFFFFFFGFFESNFLFFSLSFVFSRACGAGVEHSEGPGGGF